MLRSRVLSALVGIPVLLAIVMAGGLWLAIPITILALLGWREFYVKCRVKGVRPVVTVGYLVVLGWCVAGYCQPLNAKAYGTAALGLVYLLVMGSLAACVRRYHRDQTVPVLANASATVLGSLYTGALFSFLLLLRAREPGTAQIGASSLAFGARVLMLLLFSTWATDTGAYFIGRQYGRRKLTPASPNKTVEGAVGGLVCAAIIATAAGAGFGLPWYLSLPIGLIAGTAGQLGDLCKSVLKRDLGTKDFGELIPGHGGVLDRFDSLLMNAGLVYLWLVVMT